MILPVFLYSAHSKIVSTDSSLAMSKKPHVLIITVSEFSILFTLGALIILFGFYPEPLLETIHVSVDNLINNYNSEISRHLAFK